WDADVKLIAELKGDRYAQDRVASATRALATATANAGNRKSALQATETQHKTQIERVRKATEALAAAEKALADKQKAVTTATESKSAAEKALADIAAELKKA